MVLRIKGSVIMYCVYCGSKGGFANRLIIHPAGSDDMALIECEWCSMKKTLEASKNALEALRKEKE